MNLSVVKLFTTFYGKRDQVLSDILVDISPSDYFFLMRLSEFLEDENQDYIYVSKFAEISNVSVPAISKNIRKLEEARYLKRQTDVFCRRNTKVKITPKGYQVLEKNNKIIAEIVDEIIKQIGIDKIREALDVKAQVEQIIISRGAAKC